MPDTTSKISEPVKKPDAPKPLNMDGIVVAKGNTIHHGYPETIEYGPGTTPPFVEGEEKDVARFVKRGVLVDKNAEAEGEVPEAKKAVPAAGGDKGK